MWYYCTVVAPWQQSVLLGTKHFLRRRWSAHWRLAIPAIAVSIGGCPAGFPKVEERI